MHKNIGTNAARDHRIGASCTSGLGKIRIDQACDDAARQPNTYRISFRSQGTRSLSGTHPEHTKSPQTSFFFLRIIIVVHRGIASNELWIVSRTVQRMQAIRACVAATVRRDLKEPVAPVERSHEERVTFRWRRFLLLIYLVVTGSTAQLCLMTQDEIRERKLREAQETRNRLRSGNQEQQVAGSKREIPQPETFTHSDTSNHRSRFGSVQTTTNGRLGNVDLGLSASYRTDSFSRECTTRLHQTKTETFFGCSRFPLCTRVVYTSLTTGSRVSPSAH